MDILLDNKPLNTSSLSKIGEGGEAEILSLGNNEALKLFMGPDHANLRDYPDEQKAARKRLDLYQNKLREFPTDLPSGIIGPQKLAFSSDGKQVLGYVMEYFPDAFMLKKYSERPFREGIISDKEVISNLTKLHSIVDTTHNHKLKPVFADFNDLNILVKGNEIRVIDIDGMQWGDYFLNAFTNRFLDPLLSAPDDIRLVKRPNQMSDWYAYEIMLMQSLLYIGPYGGKYTKDRNIGKGRFFKRITILNPDVKYSPKARPLDTLPDQLLEHFRQTFEMDRRQIFPMSLLERLEYRDDGNLKATLKEETAKASIVEISNDDIEVKKILSTTGRIVFATIQDGVLKFLEHKDGKFFREGNKHVFSGELDPNFRYGISASRSVIGKASNLLIFEDYKQLMVKKIDTVGGSYPVFSTNSDSIITAVQGRLERQDLSGKNWNTFIGNVLNGQTLIWTGEDISFGFYRAGNLSRYFIFNPKERGMNESVKLPPIRGKIIDSIAVLSGKYIWFLVSVESNGRILNHAFLINHKGELLGKAEAEEGDDHWLSSIKGTVSLGKSLLVPTDDGVVKVSPLNNILAVDKTFPLTKRFVNGSQQLLVGKSGLLAVSSNTVWQLVLKGTFY